MQSMMLALLAVFAVNFDECPKCGNRMKIAPDGLSATINVCRLQDDNPSPAVLERRKAAMKARAERLMSSAADVKKPGRVARPLMGWSSWNSFRVDISDKLILEVAEAMATNGLAAAGYRYVNIDDGFFGGRDESGKLQAHPVRFPRGLKPVVDGIHALGLKAGIYSEAGSDTCGSMYDDDRLGVGSGMYGHDQEDCDFFFRELGFDFIKVDFCGGKKQGLDVERRYREIRRAIDNTGRKDVRLNICRWQFPGRWAAEVAESWRTAGDINANWWSVKKIIDENIPLAIYTKPGHYNDMDMLEVGRYKGAIDPDRSFGRHKEYGLTPEEEITHFGMWCMFSSPLLIGCDARTIPDSTVKLLCNPFLLAMNQNDLGDPVRTVRRVGEGYVFVKDCDVLGGPARYLTVYNGGDREQRFTVDLFALDLRGEVAFFDLVERADVGAYRNSYRVTVGPHQARFFRVDETSARDEGVGTLTARDELLSTAKNVTLRNCRVRCRNERKFGRNENAYRLENLVLENNEIVTVPSK